MKWSYLTASIVIGLVLLGFRTWRSFDTPQEYENDFVWDVGRADGQMQTAGEILSELWPLTRQPMQSANFDEIKTFMMTSPTLCLADEQVPAEACAIRYEFNFDEETDTGTVLSAFWFGEDQVEILNTWTLQSDGAVCYSVGQEKVSVKGPTAINSQIEIDNFLFFLTVNSVQSCELYSLDASGDSGHLIDRIQYAGSKRYVDPIRMIYFKP